MSTPKRQLYLFLDEAGNLDFSRSGTRYFLLGCITKERPFRAYQELTEVKYDLIEQGIEMPRSQKSDRPGYSCERTPWVLVTRAEPLNLWPACALRRFPFDGMEPTFRHRRPEINLAVTNQKATEISADKPLSTERLRPIQPSAFSP
jgi:hypothetical protein